MSNELSQKVAGLIGEYIKTGPENYLNMQLRKIGKDLDTFSREDIHKLIPIVEGACRILFGQEKSQKLIADIKKL